MKKWVSAVAGLLSMVFLSFPALAENYTFSYSVTGGGSWTWEEMASPTPLDYLSGNWFTLASVTNDPTNDAGTLVFYSQGQFGGYSTDSYSVNFFADNYTALYTGLESSPTFKTGSFSGTDGGASATLTITYSDVSAPVPEPETYAMIVAGLGLMGFVARRRKPKAA